VRQPTDALRSVARQLDVVLNGGPAVVGEVYWGPYGGTPVYRWTHRGMSPGALEVSEAAWTWLTRSPLGPPEPQTAAARRWERRRLIFDPTAQLAARGLPTSGRGVLAPGLLPTVPENPWEVRYAAERGEVTFPFCRVSFPTGPVTAGTSTFYTVAQAVLAELYPSAGAETAEAAMLEATDLMGLLLRGLRGERRVGDGHPLRIPLYDYDGVDLESGATQRRLPSDYLRVEALSPRPLPDAADPRRVAVVCDMRVEWRVPVSPRGGRRLVDSLRLNTSGS
jgi:hypothetical protein